MSALETYLKGIVESRGLLHAQAVRSARDYINLTPTNELKKAILQIKDTALLKALWECGLNTDLQRIVLKQLDKLIKEAL